VLSSPSPAEVATYLRQALPAAGFTITAEEAAAKDHDFRWERLDGKLHR
jgi:hypothetical protein